MARPGGVGIFQRERAFAGYQIGRSIPCRNCKYDLRGLTYVHQCPECGKPVAATLDHLFQGEATESKIADLRQGLRMASASWIVYLALLIACISPLIALVLCAIGPIMRLSAVPSFAKIREDLPVDFLMPVQLIMLMACGTLVTTLAYAVALIVLPGTSAILVGILFLLMLSAEGFTWLTQLSDFSHRLEFPLVGPVARFARWIWVGVTVVVVYLLISYIVFTSNIAFDLGQLVVVLGVGLCALITSGVTVTVSDIVRQLAITGELDTSIDPILVSVGTMPEQAAKADTAPLDVARSSGEEIRVDKSTVELRDPMNKPRDERSGPNNPTGVY